MLDLKGSERQIQFSSNLQKKPIQPQKSHTVNKMPKKVKNPLNTPKRPSDKRKKTEEDEDTPFMEIPKKNRKVTLEAVSEAQNVDTSVDRETRSNPDLNLTNWKKKDGHSKSLKFVKRDMTGQKSVNLLMKLTSCNSEGKLNWRNLKKEAVALKKLRKERKLSHFDIIIEAKRIWELLRREDCPTQRKAELIVSLYTTSKDHLIKLVFAHDTSRIVQWLIKLGTPSIRKSVCDTLAPVLVEMLQKKFSSHCVKSIFKYGDKNTISNVIDSFHGNVMKLISNSVSAPFIESAYTHHASPVQRKLMEQEFFGCSWKITLGIEAKTLKEALNSSSEIRSSILNDAKENILRVINKENVSSSLLHTVIKQYFEICTPESKEEILTLLCPNILDLVATKPGSHIAMHLCWFSSKKRKKEIVKQLKGHVQRVSLMEEGHRVILALLDAIDDTVLLNKIIISPLLSNATEIARNEYGRKVVLYLVAHRDKAYFHPMDIAVLEQGDSSETTLKSMELRREEISSPVIKSLLSSIVSEISVWMEDASVAMVTLAVLKNASGDCLRKALKALAKYICSETKVEGIPLIEHTGIHIMLKKLLKYDSSLDDAKDTFAFHVASTLDEYVIKRWILCNRGCFLLVGIIETKKEEPIRLLLKKLTEEIKRDIANGNNTGARVLKKILSEF